MSLISKDSIIQACADAYKEGTGADSVKVGELASKILSAISSGGGLPSGIAMGSFTPQEVGGSGTGDFTVEHGLGKTPHMVIGFYTGYESAHVVMGFVKRNPVYSSTSYPSISALIVKPSGGGTFGFYESTPSIADNETTFTVPPVANTSTMIYPTVMRYYWVAVTEEFLAQ